MITSLKNTSKLLIFWALIAFFSLQNLVAQPTTLDYETFKITTWNVEWLSCLSYEPKNRELQINNVVSMIKTMNSDLVALQEVGTSYLYTTIDTLVRRLGSEWGGMIVPWNANNCSQNQGIVFKKSKISLIKSELIKNGGIAYNWSSGRFPVLYEVNFVVNERQFPVSFINIHAKAYADVESYTRRKNASAELKYLLDGYDYNSKRLIILGDFNDYLKGTTCNSCGGISPYKNFMDDIHNFKGISADLKTVDHIIISNELFSSYTDTIFREYSATQTIPNYYATTSDHIPTSAIFHIAENLRITDLTEDETFRVYPNPTTGVLYIQSSKFKVQGVGIYDVYGRIIKHRSAEPQPQPTYRSYDLTVLQAGVYFVKIYTESGVVMKKVVKY